MPVTEIIKELPTVHNVVVYDAVSAEKIRMKGKKDFYSLVEHLYGNDKLKIVLSPERESCSGLLKQAAKEKIQFIKDLKVRLEYKKKSTA